MRELSGDRPLTRKEQMIYITVFLRRFVGLFAPVCTSSFMPSIIPGGSSSFFRKYIDAFLSDVIPELIPKKEITVFDIGCGSGYIRDILAWLDYSGRYTGIDIVREKRFDDHEHPTFTSSIIGSRIESYETEERYDLVFSNTSLEHVDDDALAVKKAHALRADGGIEIHIVPSWWSFFLYLWHGYRHYTPGSLASLFKGESYRIYRLGGLFSFFGHLTLITIPERYLRMRFRQRPWYPSVAERLIRLDRFLPLCPIGYAVIISHEKAR